MNSKELRAIVALRIKTHRNHMGFLQKELAKRSGLSQTTIADIEHGRKDVSLLTILKLATVFGVEPSLLLTKVQLERTSE